MDLRPIRAGGAYSSSLSSRVFRLRDLIDRATVCGGLGVEWSMSRFRSSVDTDPNS